MRRFSYIVDIDDSSKYSCVPCINVNNTCEGPRQRRGGGGVLASLSVFLTDAMSPRLLCNFEKLIRCCGNSVMKMQCVRACDANQLSPRPYSMNIIKSLSGHL